MEGRQSLDELFRATFGDKVHYYFQPPTGYMLKYPALVYNLDGLLDRHADNKVYNRRHGYAVLLILDEPDTDLVDLMDELPYCRMSGRPYTSDNLYHYPFTIYY